MNLPLVYHPDVQAEVQQAHDWYEQQQAGLGVDFLVALDAVFARLQVLPEAHAIIYQDVRRALTRRFPYGVYYRVHTDRVEVLAVQHTRCDPAHWQARV